MSLSLVIISKAVRPIYERISQVFNQEVKMNLLKNKSILHEH